MTITTFGKIAVGAVVTTIAATGIFAGCKAIWDFSDETRKNGKKSKELDEAISYEDFDKWCDSIDNFEEIYGEIKVPTPEELEKAKDEVEHLRLAVEIGEKYKLDASHIEIELRERERELREMEFLAKKVAVVMNNPTSIKNK